MSFDKKYTYFNGDFSYYYMNDNRHMCREYLYYQDIARIMTRYCKLGRNIDANEAQYYMNVPYSKCLKDACIACIKANRWYIIFFKNLKSWCYNVKSWLDKLRKNNDVLF